MTFFYNLNKKLDEIRATPELKHGQLNESVVAEKWGTETNVSPEEKGKYAGKGKAELLKAYNALKASGPHKKGSPEFGKMRELAFAIRAKSDWGKVKEENMEEGIVDTVKQGAQSALQAIGQTLGHGSDEDMIKDLQKKAGVPVTGKVPPQQPGQQPQGQLPMSEADMEEGNEFSGELAKAKASGAKEFKVDGKTYPVKEGKAAKPDYIDLDKDGNRKESMKKASADKKKGKQEELDEGWDDMLKDVKARREKTKKGEITHGHKHDIEDTGTGRRVTRRTDPNTGYSVGAEDDDKPADGEKRGRGRPKKTDKAPERVTAKAYKHKGSRKVKEGQDEGNDMVKLAKVIASCTTQAQLDTARRMAQNFLKKHQTGDLAFYGSDMKRGQAVANDIARKRDEIGGVNEDMPPGATPDDAGEYGNEGDMAKDQIHTIIRNARALEKILRNSEDLPEWVQSKLAKVEGMMSSVNDYMQSQHERGDEMAHGTDLEERAVSKAQQRFMGMAHAMQKGEKIKGASPELKKVAKTMKKGDVKDFAKTKLKGLPEKKHKEETDESTVSGSVATAAAPKAKGKSGAVVGKGIYDSMNRELESMISESMNVTVSMNTDEHGEPRKNITISAEGEAAEQLAQLLNLAGMQGHEHSDPCPTCGEVDCGCEEEMVDENAPDWPTKPETTGEDDPRMMRWSGGLNKPKETGQTTIPVVNRDPRRGSFGPAEHEADLKEATDLGMNLYREYKNYKAK
jgi:hypothetical protein